MQVGYKFALDTYTRSLYAAQITTENYLSGISTSDYFKVSQQVFLVSSLTDVIPSGEGLYITTNGESKYFDGQNWFIIQNGNKDIPEKLSQLEDDIDAANIINDIKVNGISQPINDDKSVNITVPSSIQLSGSIIGSAVFNGSDVSIQTSLGSGFTIDASNISGLTITWDAVQNKPTNIQLTGDVTGTANLETETITTEIQSLSWSKITDKPSIPSIDGLATKIYVDQQDAGVLSSAKVYTNEQVSGKADKSDLNGLASETFVSNSIISALTSTIKAKGTVLTSGDLPASAVVNDLYFVGPINDKYTEYVKTSEGWEELGIINDIDLNDYAKTEFVKQQVSGKVATSSLVYKIDENANETTIPTTKAVYDFVRADADVFYIETFDEYTEDKVPELSGLYIDHDGESRLWTGTIWQNISYEIVTEMLSNVNDDTVPTTKAVYDFINNADYVVSSELAIVKSEAIASAKTYTDSQVSGKANKSELTNLASKTFVEQQVSGKANKSDIPNISNLASMTYVNQQVSGKADKSELTNLASMTYVNSQVSGKADKSELTDLASKTYVSQQVSSKIDKSDIAQNFTSITSSKIPSVKAVQEYVNAQNAAIPPEIFYIKTFDVYTATNKPAVSGFYVDQNGQSRLWNGTDWEYTSHEITKVIDANSTDKTVPTAKAVYTYVQNNQSTGGGSVPEVFYINSFENYTPSTSGFYIDHDGETRYWDGKNWEYTSRRVINNLNGTILSGDVPTAKAVLDYVQKITSENVSGNVSGNNLTEIEIDSSFPSIGEPDKIYINSTSNEVKYYDSEWKNLSIKAIRNMTGNESDDVVPTTKALASYLDTKLETKAGISIGNNLPTVGDENTLYISETGEVAVKINDEIKNISVDVVDDIQNAGTDMNIPTCEAVKEYINLLLNGKTVTDSTNTSVNLEVATNTYYKFTQKLTSLSLILNSGLRNVTIEFSTGSSFSYDCTVNGNFKISKQFEFTTDKNYVIAINNDLIIWSEVEEYV